MDHTANLLRDFTTGHIGGSAPNAHIVDDSSTLSATYDVRPTGFNAGGINFRVISGDASAMKMAYRLRYDVYCEEKGFLPKQNRPGLLEVDEYDQHSIHIGAFDENNTLVGSARLVLPQEQIGLPLHQHCNLYDKHESTRGKSVVYQTRSAEISRIVVKKSSRGRNESRLWKMAKNSLRFTNLYKYLKMARSRNVCVALGLYKAIHLVAEAEGITDLYAAIEPRYYKALCRYNIDLVQIGPEVDYYGEVAPYSINIGTSRSAMYQHSKLFYLYFFKLLARKPLTQNDSNVRT